MASSQCAPLRSLPQHFKRNLIAKRKNLVMTVLIWLIISGNKEQNINDEIVHTFYSNNFHPPIHQKEQIYLHKDLQTHTMQCFSFSKRSKRKSSMVFLSIILSDFWTFRSRQFKQSSYFLLSVFIYYQLNVYI